MKKYQKISKNIKNIKQKVFIHEEKWHQAPFAQKFVQVR
jgi:hypothetical protein